MTGGGWFHSSCWCRRRAALLKGKGKIKIKIKGCGQECPLHTFNFHTGCTI